MIIFIWKKVYANAAERQTSEPTCLLRRLMPVETARAAFDLFMEYPGGMGVFWNGYSVRDQASVDFAAARWARLHSTEARQPNDGRFLVVRDLGEWMSRHAHEVEKQCLFFAEQDQVPQALARFRAMPGVEVVQGSPENIEVTAAGVDKGEALLTLADRLGIPRAQTLAVGDSENDRAMLEKAGYCAVCQLQTIRLELLISQIFHFPLPCSCPVYGFIMHQHNYSILCHARIYFYNIYSSP